MKRISILLSTVCMLFSISVCGMTMNKKEKVHSAQKTTHSAPIAKQETDTKTESDKEVDKTRVKEASEDITLRYKLSKREDNELKEVGSLNMYFSKGAFCLETHINYSKGGITGHINVSVIRKADDPDHAFMVNDKQKAYREIDLNAAPKNIKGKGEIEVLKKEKFKGYNCTIVKVTSTGNPFGGKQVTKNWMTKDMKGLKVLTDFLHNSPKLMKEQNVGIYKYGIPVKQITEKKGTVTDKVVLVNVDYDNISEDKFQVPEGYKKISF